MRMLTTVIGALVLTVGVACNSAKAEEVAKAVDTKKICFVAGRDSHGRTAHAHGPGLQYFADELKAHMPNIETAIHRGGWPQDPTFFDGADAIVIYCDGGPQHVVMNHLDEVDEMAAAGVGIGCLHYGVEIPKGPPGDFLLKWTGGYFETHWSVNPFWMATFSNIPEHPVTRGVKPFSMYDEWYFHMRFPEGMAGVTPVLSAVAPLETLKRADGPHSNNPTVRQEVNAGVPQHLAWVITRPDGGRGFGTTGGHNHMGWKEDNYRRLVLNAIVWIAKGEVPAEGVASPTPTDAQLSAYLEK